MDKEAEERRHGGRRRSASGSVSFCWSRSQDSSTVETETEGKRERQLSSVQQHISLLAPFIAYKRGPVIIRHYDEWKGDHADHTLWMLTLGSTKPRQWLVVDEQIGYGMGFEVDQDGEFLEHYSESPNVVGHVYEIIGPESRFRQNSISVRNTDNNEIHDIALPSASHQN